MDYKTIVLKSNDPLELNSYLNLLPEKTVQELTCLMYLGRGIIEETLPKDASIKDIVKEPYISQDKQHNIGVLVEKHKNIPLYFSQLHF